MVVGRTCKCTAGWQQGQKCPPATSQLTSAHIPSLHSPSASRQADLRWAVLPTGLSALHGSRTKAGDCQLLTQLPSKGSPFSKYTSDLISLMLVCGEFETGICKGRIAHVTRFLLPKVTYKPSQSISACQHRTGSPLGMAQPHREQNSPSGTNSSFTCLQLAHTPDLAREGHRCGCEQHTHGM